MKYIIDSEPKDSVFALDAIFNTQRQNPDQKIGTSNAIITRVAGRDFVVTRNKDSYTAKVK